MADQVNWMGNSGRKYMYWSYPISTNFREDPGNYIFALQDATGTWTPTYIGQTFNLNQRLENPEKEYCARRNGATHLHVHSTPGGEAVRIAEEQDLIAEWKPVCNDQRT